MGWRGVPGSSCAVEPMPALLDCFMFIMWLMRQPAPELPGWQR